METYKDVERSSKLKTFSNQSILLSAIDQQNSMNRDSGDEEDSDNYEGTDLEEFLSEIEEDELEDQLPMEYIDSIKFIKDIINQLNKQTQKFNHEYEKLCNKKVRKNNLNIIESKKEKINQTLSQHKFYIKRLLKIIKLLKNLKFNEINLFNLIKDDLVKYVDNNDNYDASLFDDIMNSLSIDDNYSELNDSEIYHTARDDLTTSGTSNPISLSIQSNILNNHSDPIRIQSDTTHSPAHSRQANGNSHKDITFNNSNNINSNPIDFTNNGFHKSITSSPIPSSPETESSAIIKSLKPASTPSKPVGNLKWSTAAAAGISEPSQDETSTVSSEPDVVNGPKELLMTPPPTAASNTLPSQPNVNDPHYSYVEVLKNSSLSPIEVNLFSDLSLVKLPPGIQDLIISFTAKRNNCENNKLIYDSNNYNQFVTPIRKPYLPQQVQPSLLKPTNFKQPVQLFKLQSYWNKIRANNQFDQFLLEIESLLLNPANIENISIANELSLVLFYGYYYGLTPVENLVAESCLFQLGWKPYKTKADASTLLHSQMTSIIEQNNNSFLYWFKQIKSISSSNEDPNNSVEFGDYHVFDLSSWEFYIKYGFKFEHKYCQTEPSKALF